jgi:hypothetical protein
VFFVVISLNFLLGLSSGFLIAMRRKIYVKEETEKEIYCHGFESGIYYTLDEYCPEMFRVEIAEDSYKEYKAIKYGPEKH